MKLRDYQEECISKIMSGMHTDADQLAMGPTGVGKTVIFCELVKRAIELMKNDGRELKTVILVNQIRLVEQTVESLLKFIPENKIGIYCGSLNKKQDDAAVLVATIQSIKNHKPFVHLLIIDEAHRAANAPMYSKFIDVLKEINPKLKIVRFTATPFTSNGYLYGPKKDIKKLVFKRTLKEMIAEGYLVPPVFDSVEHSFDTSGLKKRKGEFILKELTELTNDEKKIKEQVKDALSRLNGRKKIIWAGTCIEHAEAIHREISLYEQATIVHSKLSKDEQAFNFNEFVDSDVRHCSSVTMLGEGLDIPAIDAIVCMRPTRSPVLYVQLVGRGLRLFPGKTDCLFLDYGKAVENLGHPNNPVVTEKGTKAVDPRVIICPACRHYIFLPAKGCSNCSYELEIIERKKLEHSKNLTKKAGGVQFVDMKKEEIVAISSWELDRDYVSKAGNKCIKVVYKSFLGEYFQYAKIGTWVHKKLEEDLLLYNGDAPKSVKVVKDGKWKNVVERYF